MRHESILDANIGNTNWSIRIAHNGHESEPATLLADCLHEPPLFEGRWEGLNAVTVHRGYGAA